MNIGNFRLYHAHTHEHLQDVDIEPYVSKMLGKISQKLVFLNFFIIKTGAESSTLIFII